ncbi:MAG TPA: (2Fe-2S)-binding protein [Kofleriaceae bacterium]|nr:(2Fe-2S)-binding protein [Kofleriaceae bacterium]
MTRYVLVVNGREVAVEAPGEASLLDVLRDQLDLTGAKYGCGEGKCGACCVLVDGESLPACRQRLADIGERAIVTVEGLAAGGELSAVQEAFVEENAMQCGYCTAGMVIATTALLAKTPTPSGAEIRAALEPHLCRCGVYERAIRAAKRVAGGGR